MHEKESHSLGVGAMLTVAFTTLTFATTVWPVQADAQSASCDSGQFKALRRELPGWGLTDRDTIDKANRFIDVSTSCSAASSEPQKSSYVLGIALGAEVEARALRTQGHGDGNEFSELAHRANILFSFVVHDRRASDEDRRTAERHLTTMGELVGPA